jgi:UDP-N-acetyl-D-glucosamine/UDP-N-acetyl-D-galactosamine dehydrogenase
MQKKIGIIGLGYVGLPLAMAFSKKFEVIGFDIDKERVDQLNLFEDKTNQAPQKELKQVLRTNLTLTSDPNLISDCNIYIVTVPTPVTIEKTPDLSFLLSASKTVGLFLKKGDLVIYESTVYPGCTEDDCVPVLERSSGLVFNKDFYCGYSPERINPGDKVNTLTKIKKVTSGSTPKAAHQVDELYNSIIKAGTHKTSSIMVAEASKAIENAQRDLNISFVNELALIFDRIGIDTTEVIEAAATKWNFLKFKPGLVGGHCISVDPYFLVHKAKSLGYTPEVILSGRNVNDQMGKFVASKVIRLMKEKGIKIQGSKALILGVTFKENCNDIRNSKVPDIYKELKESGLAVDLYDPIADGEQVTKTHQITLTKTPSKYQAIILAVSHDLFIENGVKDYKNLNGAVIYDIKSVLNRADVDGRL